MPSPDGMLPVQAYRVDSLPNERRSARRGGGLARNGTGDKTGAIAALRRGEEANPADPSVPYARATIHAQLGQLDEARGAAMKALQIQPDYRDARQLLQSRQGGR